jgi:hypothetical protein
MLIIRHELTQITTINDFRSSLLRDLCCTTVFWLSKLVLNSQLANAPRDALGLHTWNIDISNQSLSDTIPSNSSVGDVTWLFCVHGRSR